MRSDKGDKMAENNLERKLERMTEVFEDGLISFLILEGVGKQEIRKIVGVMLTRITRVSKQLKRTLKKRRQEVVK